MPRVPRILFEGAFYHVYNRGVEKRPLFLDNRDRKTFLQILGDTVQECHLRLFAYCLMDNHFHLLLQTTLANLPEAMQKLEGQYAHYLNLRYERIGPLFQGRYKSRLVDTESYFPTLVRYIHRNPFEGGMAIHLEDYPWSSYPCYLGKLPTWKWLETDWVLSQFHQDHASAKRLFKEFHQKGSTESDLQVVRRLEPKRGRPAKQKGSDPFC